MRGLWWTGLLVLALVALPISAQGTDVVDIEVVEPEPGPGGGTGGGDGGEPRIGSSDPVGSFLLQLGGERYPAQVGMLTLNADGCATLTVSPGPTRALASQEVSGHGTWRAIGERRARIRVLYFGYLPYAPGEVEYVGRVTATLEFGSGFRRAVGTAFMEEFEPDRILDALEPDLAELPRYAERRRVRLTRTQVR